MSGKPASRISDGVANGQIVQGSRTVLIGSQGGIACSVCPGCVTEGDPVNPVLGAKVLPDEVDGALPQAGWQRYDRGHLIGVGLGSHVMVELPQDKLHREAERVSGSYRELRRYTAAGQLAEKVTGSETQDYRYDIRGLLTSTGAERQYGYDEHGRLIIAVQPGLSAAYHYDPAGNRVDGEGQQQFDNRPAQDSQWQYEYDAWGNLIKKRNEREKHLYTYDLLHRLTGFEKQTPDGAVTKATYHYDPSGRRISKTVRRNNQSDTTRYGWDGDRLVMTEKNGQKVHTLYEPGSFTPLLRIEGDGGDEPYTPLADKLRQHSRIPFTAQEYADMERLEDDLRTGKLSERSRGWLEFANIPVNLMAAQLDPLPVVNIRQVHLYQCDHRGMPAALINREGQTDWRAEIDPWGDILSEENPHNIEQPLRLPGQWYDEESGLHYNRYRYYDPQQGKYITQDPIGLRGGWNLYQYPLDPIVDTDPLGLWAFAIPAIIEGVNWLLVGSAAAGGAVLTTSGDSEKSKTENLTKCEEKKPCPPCKTISGNIVPRGTIGYRQDLVPPGKPHHPYTGDHYNLYKANQNPKNCRCFWTESGAADAANDLPPPAGSIPIEPFAP